MRSRGRRMVAALRAGGSALRGVCAAVIGVPDYERYVAHLRRHHPDQAPQPRAEFAREQMRRRYDRPGSRCC